MKAFCRMVLFTALYLNFNPAYSNEMEMNCPIENGFYESHDPQIMGGVTKCEILSQHLVIYAELGTCTMRFMQLPESDVWYHPDAFPHNDRCLAHLYIENTKKYRVKFQHYPREVHFSLKEQEFFLIGRLFSQRLLAVMHCHLLLHDIFHSNIKFKIRVLAIIGRIIITSGNKFKLTSTITCF